ncbi:MAG: flagellin-like protein [Natronomonas sp.]|jgi:flagellin-like protein|uniref:type IV pilin n=1 Tax=Natronomonas sp. TaxID=2184060 RepID=UPI003989A5BC
MSGRAVAPVIGVVLLTAITVVAASALGAAVVVDPPEPPPTAAFDAEADSAGEIRVTHLGGDPLATESLRVRVRVDEEPLEEQPPVPFFAARGFESGPTGAFNSATAGEWRAGETAGFTLAGTNEPSLSVGKSVEISLYADGQRIAVLETAVQAASTASTSVGSSVSSSGT